MHVSHSSLKYDELLLPRALFYHEESAYNQILDKTHFLVVVDNISHVLRQRCGIKLCIKLRESSKETLDCVIESICHLPEVCECKIQEWRQFLMVAVLLLVNKNYSCTTCVARTFSPTCVVYLSH
jgi:hypothetical protein